MKDWILKLAQKDTSKDSKSKEVKAEEVTTSQGKEAVDLNILKDLKENLGKQFPYFIGPDGGDYGLSELPNNSEVLEAILNAFLQEAVETNFYGGQFADSTNDYIMNKIKPLVDEGINQIIEEESEE